MPRPGRQPIVEILKPILKERGFRKVALNWRKVKGDFIQVFNLQSGGFGDYYMLNMGLAIRSKGSSEQPTEASCDLRYRLDSLRRKQPGKPDVLDMETPMDPAIREQHIRRLTDESLKWLEEMASREAILDVIEKRKADPAAFARVWICRGAYEYAGVPLPKPAKSSKKKPAVQIIAVDIKSRFFKT